MWEASFATLFRRKTTIQKISNVSMISFLFLTTTSLNFVNIFESFVQDADIPAYITPIYIRI